MQAHPVAPAQSQAASAAALPGTGARKRHCTAAAPLPANPPLRDQVLTKMAAHGSRQPGPAQYIAGSWIPDHQVFLAETDKPQT